MFSFPAPHMEEFTGPTICNPFNPPEPLFADHAPMLRSINASRCFLHMRSRWLSQLNSITLNGTYCLSDAYTVLSAACRLQELKIIDIPLGDTNAFRPIISLPHLQDLNYLSNCCNSGVTLLNNIEIPTSCSLTVHVTNFFDCKSLLYKTPFLFSVIDKFIQHAERSFKSYIFNCLDLGPSHPHKDHFFFQCNAAGPKKRQIRISIPLVPDPDGNILQMFFTKLRVLSFSSIRMVKFTAHTRLDSCFGSLFSCLSSLTMISTDLRTLSHLLNFQKEFTETATEKFKPSVFFPILRVINLYIYPGYPRSVFFVNQVAGAFLVSRWRAGFPRYLGHVLLSTAQNCAQFASAWRREGSHGDV